MNVVDLFSGIGGFSLGLEAAGMRTVAFCEIDKFCQKILRRHWPEVPIYEDVRKFSAATIPCTIDVICGGYPCQGESTAGKRRGKEDERWLWPAMLEFIRSVVSKQPAHGLWIIAENVYGHISLGFDEVAASLEAEGFTVWPFIIPASAVDAPHRRDRIWIIAYRESDGRAAGRSRGSDPGDKRKSEQALSAMADSIGAGLERYAGHDAQAPGREKPDRSTGATGICGDVADAQGVAERPGFCAHGTPEFWRRRFIDRCGSMRAGWESEPDVGRVAHGIPDRVDRLCGLGNSVVPYIPFLIGCAIIARQGAAR